MKARRFLSGIALLAALTLCGGSASVAAEPELAAAREAIATGHYEEGLAAIEALLADAAEGAERAARGLRIRAWLATGRYDDATQEAARLERLAPDDPDALARSATALMETGRYDEAAARLARARKVDPGHIEARLLTLQLAEIRGDRAAWDEQQGYFFALYAQGEAKSAEALTAVARAAQRDDPHGAWRAYQEAQRADPEHLEAYVHAGFHCTSKYAWALARRNFEQALERNPRLAVARVGLAAVLLANNHYDQATQAIEQALRVNPALPLAHLLKAAMLAVERKHEESLAEVRQALAVNPNDPEALALLAAHYEAVGRPGLRDKAIARVHAINPHNAEVYATLAVASQRLRRLPAAVAWARQAIERDPDYWRGYYLAGKCLLLSGEEQEGYRLLDRAFRMNSFNVWAYNMLTVLDRDFKRKEFVYHRTPHFFVKLDRSEDAVLWPYLELALEPMYERLTAKYGVRPDGPEQYGGRTLVLLFPKHSEFSARTVGLPGLSALGACLGQVITMPSPRVARGRGVRPFNWRQVLVHEFAHVLTLQKTRYNIPRWLTEGLSVSEEGDTRTKWDGLLVHALAHDKLLPLEDLDAGFTRPTFRAQVPLSYYQAFLTCRYLEQTCGFEAILGLLRRFREGGQLEDVLPQVTGKSLEEVNAEALATIRRYAEQIKLSPRETEATLARLEKQAKEGEADAAAWTRIAAGRVAARRFEPAREAARKALELQPDIARAHAILGLVAEAKDRDAEAAREHYLRARELDPDYFFAAWHLGLLAAKEGRREEAIAQLEAARRIYPRARTRGKGLHLRLAELYVQAGEPRKAIGVLRQGTRLDASDAPAQVRLAELLAEQGRHAEAAEAYLRAIYVDPFEPKVHLAAAQAYEAAGDHAQAAREYGVAAAIEPQNLAALVGRARALAAAGQHDAAREAVQAIRKVDPHNAEADAIEKALGN
ncbi:MAG: tetratricopeptide repeat protein [Candidatus Brocadiia bacterium]